MRSESHVATAARGYGRLRGDGGASSPTAARVTRVNAGRRTPWSGWWFGSTLVAVGAAASAYLLARTFALIAPGAHASHDICAALFAASCDGALADERAWILGIPLAGWGLVYFAAAGALLALARFVEGAFESLALIVASALALAGAGAGVALTLGAWPGGAPICPMCVSIHATSVALVIVLQWTIGRPIREQFALVREAWAGLARAGAPSAEPARWSFVGFGFVALVASLTWQWVYVESVLRRPPPAPAPDRAAAIAAFNASPQSTLPVSPSDPHRGPLGAPVQLVVFESLQCPHCMRFAPTLARLEREFGDRLVVVFKHYPLSSRCNARLDVDLQPGACEIAWAAEAAHRQSRFWQFHDAMLATGTRVTAGSIEQAAHGAGLDPARFEADRRSPEVRERVAQDIELGNQLRLPGTPAAFLDGRLVRTASAELLEILIRHELERDAAKSPPVGRAGTGSARAAATTLDGRLNESAGPPQAAGSGRLDTQWLRRRFVCGD